MKYPYRILALSILLSMAGCGGGGGGGGGGGSPPPPPSGLSYPQPSPLIVNSAMTPLTPTVTGQVTTWTVNAPLPTGITLDTTTGVISGTPTQASNGGTYTITAANAGGKTSTTVSLEVVSASISYRYSNYVFAPGAVAQTLSPVIGAVTFSSWSVSPPLPTGLTLDPTTGSISGLPTTATAATQYKITASEPEGAASTTLTIAVAGTKLLDLGLGASVTLIRYANTSVLSQDSTGAWVLQDHTSGATLAEGAGLTNAGYGFEDNTNFNTYVDLENNLMIDDTPTTLEVRSATTGQVLASIPIPAPPLCVDTMSSCPVPWYRLATDGSYVVGGSPTALTVWSTSGQTLLSLSGNYSQTLVFGGPSNSPTGLQPFAAPGQIQIAEGPAGANVIQTITVPGGVSSLSPGFQGTFSSWFADGQRFLTSQGNGSTVTTYSAAAVQQDITAITTTPPFALAGSGNWFWTCDDVGTVNVYKVGSSSSPALIIGGCNYGYPPLASGNTLGVLASTGVTVIDLSGATLSSTSVPFATGAYNFLSAYAAESPTSWLVGNNLGVVFDGASLGGTPRALTLGAVLSIAAGSSYISVATAAGKTFFFDATTNALAGTIDFPAYQLAASSDGTVLAAYADWQLMQSTDSTLNVYSLPSGAVINSFSYSTPGMALTSVGLSGSGTVLAETFNSPSTECLIQVIAVAGGAPIVCDNSTADMQVQVSPDGTLTAISQAPSLSVATRIYKNGILATAVPGYAVGWLDNGNLLVNTYSEPGIGLEGAGLNTYNSTGTQVGSTPLLTTDHLRIAPGSTSLYDSSNNTIVSLSSGAPTWANGTASNTTVGLTPSQVVFAADNVVLAVPY
jgi:hypothetical protein